VETVALFASVDVDRCRAATRLGWFRNQTSRANAIRTLQSATSSAADWLEPRNQFSADSQGVWKITLLSHVWG